jgi:hypothetical protein
MTVGSVFYALSAFLARIRAIPLLTDELGAAVRVVAFEHERLTAHSADLLVRRD